jgi:L-ascorbate metabolism protein UlaG (beta-lactamase superfamily)
VMVPMHYGTFWLAEEPLEEPLPRLLASAGRLGLAGHIAVVGEGETRVFGVTGQILGDSQESGTMSAL